MARFAWILGGALAGLVVGYLLGAYIACTWLYPTSNLCGIYGVFLTGPIGLLLGGVCGWMKTRSRRS
jgi:hypothetical protein